ncbi:MAG: hypothetical protein DMF68_06645 [Acidobacteria bacterium]|nr:MAG: hypothetical protein DMF68_06645 [Acidobacteriota bacterium]
MAKTICTLLGVVFLLVGIIGFFNHDLLGTHLTTAHNLVHIISGLIALYFGLAGSLSGARGFALAFGAIYLLLGVCGFILGDSANDRMLNIIPNQLMLGTRDHAVHILLGVLFLIGALATRSDAGAD